MTDGNGTVTQLILQWLSGEQAFGTDLVGVDVEKNQAKGDYTLVGGGGEMLRAPLSFSGTSGVLRFDQPASEISATITNEGLDHHISLTYGDYVDELLALAKMLDLPVLRLT